MPEPFGERVAALEKLLAAATPGPVAWLIDYTYPNGRKTQAVHRHNSIGDYRHIDPEATSTPLCAATFEPEAIRALLTALREQQRALEAIAENSNEENEWDAVEKLHENETTARATLQKWRIDE